MASQLPSNGQPRLQLASVNEPAVDHLGQRFADLKIFWGPEICRLEYLVHLLDTGRIKDEYRQCSA